MSHINDYIEKTKEKFSQYPHLAEQEKIMLVYLDLGKRFKFDANFFFGGSNMKKHIYEHSNHSQTMEECFENNLIICRSASYIMEAVLKGLNINVVTVKDMQDTRKYKHVYNIIHPADGSESYIIDLQEDITYIHYHAFTKNFGVSIDDSTNYVISREAQKQMHTKFGYISPTNPYVDDYIYLFKQQLPMMDNIHEQIDFVLKNIDPFEYPNIDYWERRWKHYRFLQALFGPFKLKDILHTVEFYKKNDKGKKEFINGFFDYPHGGIRIYLYSKDSNQYDSYTLTQFAEKVIHEEIGYNQPIMGLEHEIHRIKKEQHERDIH